MESPSECEIKPSGFISHGIVVILKRPLRRLRLRCEDNIRKDLI